jgi:peptidylprolyl isomerase
MRLKRHALFGVILASLAMASLACGSDSNTTPSDSNPAWTPIRSGGIMQFSGPPPMTVDQNKEYTATVKTNYGDIVIQLLPKDAPVTVNNFVSLARQGYFNGVKFHRVARGFVIQGGDPTGTGSGGPGYRFNDELPNKRSYDVGVVAMANAGPNTNGSQFFIGSGTQVRNLNSIPNYTIFGQVSSGSDVVQKINDVPTGGSRGESPTVDVHIDTITIEEK